MRAVGAPLLLLLFAPALARAEGYAELGVLERGAVDTALAARGLHIEPAPAGKVVGTVQVVNLDVFQPADGGLLEWFNHFHRTTREHHIRRESLLVPGMAYDQALCEETMRNLRNRTPYSGNDPNLSSMVAIVPVQAAAAGTVDLLIVTRDMWSLRFNTDYNYEPGYLITLSTSLSENNLFGWRKHVALAYRLGPGDMHAGPTYFDPNVLGSRLRLTTAFMEIWARRLGEIAAGPREGYYGWLRLEYPLYALSRRWGAFVDGSYVSSVARSISGSTLRSWNPSTGTCAAPGEPDFVGADPAAACALRSRVGSVSSGITRSFPRSWLIQRVTVGNEFGLNRPAFLPEFPAAERDAFAQAFFRTSERTSSLYLMYQAFTPRYRTYRNLDTFDLAEDQRLGPWVTLKLGRASTWLGSESDFFVLRTEVHVNLALLDGFQSIGASWDSRRYGDGWRDQLVQAQLLATSPMLARSFRIVLAGNLGFQADNVHRGRFYVGGLEGLRGYPVNFFWGYDYYNAHLEVRSAPVALASLRLGALAFGDAGHAADAWRKLQLFADAGVGARLLIPQLNVEVLRCDWAFPFRGYGKVTPGWPGRLFCGFRQGF
jgi:hypothetical protein